MVKLTVAEIKRQISALEAKALRLAEEESKASVAKVRALMDSLGVTIEHLTTTVSKRVSDAKKAIAGKKTSAAKRAGAGVVRYRDPETGATWTGFGRAPGWIASAEDREVFAVGKSAGRAAAKKSTEPKQTAKPKRAAASRKAAASKKLARPKAKAKAAASKSAAAAKRVAKKIKPVAEASAAKHPAARKATPRKAVAKKAAAAPVSTAAPEAVENSQAS